MKKNKEIKREIQHLKTGTRVGAGILILLLIIKLLSLLRFRGPGRGNGQGTGQGQNGQDSGAEQGVETAQNLSDTRQQGPQLDQVQQAVTVQTTPPPFIGQDRPQTVLPTGQTGEQPAPRLGFTVTSIFYLREEGGQVYAAVWQYNQDRSLIDYQLRISIGGPTDIGVALRRAYASVNADSIDSARVLITGLEPRLIYYWGPHLFVNIKAGTPSVNNLELGFKTEYGISVFNNGYHSEVDSCEVRFSTRELADIRERNILSRYPSYTHAWYSIKATTAGRDPNTNEFSTWALLEENKRKPTINESTYTREVLARLYDVVLQMPQFTDNIFNSNGASYRILFSSSDGNSGNYRLSNDWIAYVFMILFSLEAREVYVKSGIRVKITNVGVINVSDLNFVNENWMF